MIDWEVSGFMGGEQVRTSVEARSWDAAYDAALSLGYDRNGLRVWSDQQIPGEAGSMTHFIKDPVARRVTPRAVNDESAQTVAELREEIRRIRVASEKHHKFSIVRVLCLLFLLLGGPILLLMILGGLLDFLGG